MAAPAAQGATYHVLAGEPDRKGAPERAFQNRFMPAAIQVHVGDEVQWMAGAGAPHTVTFLNGNDFAPSSLVVPDPKGAVYDQFLDAAGVAFPYSGKSKFIYNFGAIVFPKGGKEVRGGTKLQSSGLFGRGNDFPAQSATYTFPKTGVYRYNCLLHPGMKGTVIVKPEAARIARPAAVERVAAAQVKKGWATSKALLKAPLPPNTIVSPAKVDAGGDVALFMFRPAKLTIPVGTPLTFRNQAATEAHNIGFGSKAYIEGRFKAEDKFPDAGPTAPNQVAGFLTYGTEDPTLGSDGPFAYAGPAHHGNGFMSLPIKDNSKLTPQFTNSNQITFTTPGTYEAYCILHFPDMRTTITVTP